MHDTTPHTPTVQVDDDALTSLHTDPSCLFGLLHVPLPGSQLPATWHWSRALHTTGLLPVQVPAWHVSVCVHALPSLHAVPLALFGLLQTPFAALHTPAV